MLRISMPRTCIWLSAITCLSACVLAITPPGQQRIGQALAYYHWRCLLVAEADDAAVHAAALAEQGPRGTPYLVEALTSPRIVAARAAQQALQQDMAIGEAQNPNACRTRLRALTLALAAHVDRLPPSSREFAMRQACRLLAEPFESSGNDAALRACETILQASAENRSTSDGQATLNAWQNADNADETRGYAEWSHKADELLVASSNRLSGGSLTIPNSNASLLVASQFEAEATGNESEAITSPATASIAANDSSAMKPLRIALSDASPVQGDLRPGADELHIVSQGRVALANEDPQANSAIERANYTATAPHRPDDAEDDSTLRYMHQLHCDDPQEAAAAEAALAARGFGRRELELARRLTHEDAEVRRELAETLPAVRGIDAKIWLTWLSRDRVADVRLAALTVMATGGQSQMLAHVARVAKTDDDPRIQKLGAQLSTSRGK